MKNSCNDKKLLFLTLLVSCLCLNCSKDGDSPLTDVLDPNSIEFIPFDSINREIQFICEWENLNLTEENSSITFSDFNGQTTRPWNVKYSDTTVEISFTSTCGDECAATTIYVFRKNDECIGLEYSYTTTYDLYDGRDVHELTSVITLEIQEWIFDQKLVGQVSFTHPNIDETFVNKFWIDISEDAYFVPAETATVPFEECYGNQLPLNIDINSDGLQDFAFRSEIYQRLDLTPQRNTYGISVNSLSSNYSFLMEEGDVGVIFSTEFGLVTSENKPDYPHNKASLAAYIDYNVPYKFYNNWDSMYLNHFYGYPNLMNNYLLIKKTVGSNAYYGWINFTIDIGNCDITIHDTYINSLANQHVNIN